MQGWPGKEFFGVICEKNFGLANHPAFHFQTKEEETTVICRHVYRFLEIESQELIPERKKN